MSGIKRESKPSNTQRDQDALIATRDVVRYVLASGKDDGTVEHVDEGPFPHKAGRTWQTVTPSVGRQQLLAMQRKNMEGGLPLFVAVEAHVADGNGGIKVVKGKDIPGIYDSAAGRPVFFAAPTPEWEAARAENIKAREEVAQRGRAAVKTAVAQIAHEAVAVAEKAKPSRNAPV